MRKDFLVNLCVFVSLWQIVFGFINLPNRIKYIKLIKYIKSIKRRENKAYQHVVVFLILNRHS
jgi:hypothetical protein